MKDILKQLILNFHDFELPSLIRRDFSVPTLLENVRKAVVFTGMRRSGKTWSLYQVMKDLIKDGVEKKQILYINFEDERLLPFNSKNFEMLINVYFELYPQYINSKAVHFFFDEIHEIDGWERFIRRILDSEKAKVYITGSSAKMLSREIATSLRGRTITIEIFPFNFREFLKSLDIYDRPPFSSKKRARISHFFNEYVCFGGFPESIETDKSLHSQILQSYVNTVIYRDIAERYNIKNIMPLKELVRFSLQNVSSSISINKIYNTFKIRGIEVGKNSLYEYYTYLEDAYFLFLVPRFTYSQHRQAVNPKKVYTVDTGLITAFSIKPEFNRTACMENVVFSTLRRRKQQIFYYKTKNRREVDFVSQDVKGNIQLIQVCDNLRDEKTRQREIISLKEAMSETGIKEGLIITSDEKEGTNSSSGKIEEVSIIEWLLN